MTARLLILLVTFASLAGCFAPTRGAPAPQPQRSSGSGPQVETQPLPPPSVSQEPLPRPGPPPPPPRPEPTLNSASRSLVSQAQALSAARNFPAAADSIERALRIEPNNPLLWLELAKIRFVEGNYGQADNLARKSISLSGSTPRTQAAAWKIIADALRARGRNPEAQEADSRAETLLGGT